MLWQTRKLSASAPCSPDFTCSSVCVVQAGIWPSYSVGIA